MSLQKRFGFVDGHVDFTLLILARDDFDVRRFFFDATLESFEAIIEIWGTEAALEDSDLAFVIHDFDEFLSAGITGSLIHRADIGQRLGGGSGRIKGNDFDAGFGRFVDCRNKALVVESRDRDAITWRAITFSMISTSCGTSNAL